MTEEFVSKSQRKRDAHRVQQLGETLVSLPRSELDNLSLPDQLVTAIQEARRLTKHGARRRQLQYIGKLMRQIDCEPIIAALTQRDAESARERATFHNVEYWRDQLILHGDTVITELLDAHVSLDSQQVRLWIRTARKQQTAAKPPTAARALFRHLREVNSNSPLPDPPAKKES